MNGNYKFNIKLLKVMRKISFIFISSLIGIFVLFACDNDLFQNKSEIESKTWNETDDYTNPRNWKEQIEYAQKNYMAKVLKKHEWKSSSLCLENYTYKGVISTDDDLEKVKQRLCSDEAYMLWYRNNDVNDYEIITIGEIKQRYDGSEVVRSLDSIRIQLDRELHLGMEIIELNWSFKGEKYESFAVANKDSCILYETIGYYYIDDDKLERKLVGTVVPRIQKRTEPTPKQVFELNEDLTGGIFNNVVCEYHFRCTSLFDVSTGGLKDVSMSASHNSAIGWNATSDIGTIDGTIDQDKFHIFAWACGATRLGTVTLSLGYSGYTISGATFGDKGIETHRIK